MCVQMFIWDIWLVTFCVCLKGATIVVLAGDIALLVTCFDLIDFYGCFLLLLFLHRHQQETVATRSHFITIWKINVNLFQVNSPLPSSLLPLEFRNGFLFAICLMLLFFSFNFNRHMSIMSICVCGFWGRDNWQFCIPSILPLWHTLIPHTLEYWLKNYKLKLNK